MVDHDADRLFLENGMVKIMFHSAYYSYDLWCIYENSFSDPDDQVNLYRAFAAIDRENSHGTQYTCRNHPVVNKYYYYEFMRIMLILSIRMENTYYVVSRSVQSIT